MNNTRLKQIMENLEGKGTNPNTMYSNQEIVNRLIELQEEMARGVFEKTHADNLSSKDIMIHLEALAKEYSLDDTDTFIRFKKNMNEFSYTIGSFIKGMNGEKIAKRALKLLTYDKDVRILYNVQLEAEEVQAEYDAIVIAPYGVFVIEVKNWGGSLSISQGGLLTRNDGSDITYDLAGRMSVKEALLREYLKELFPNDYYSMLLLANERVRVEGEYYRTPVFKGGGIAYEIRAYKKHENTMAKEQIEKIADIIFANHKEQKTTCHVKCDEIIEDYAKLMVEIEAASNKGAEEVADAGGFATESVFLRHDKNVQPWYKRVDWGNVVAGAVTIIIPTVAMATMKYKK